MKHYRAQEWVDFVRGTVGKDQKAVMQTHLDSGCRRCQREAKTWQRVRETANRQMAAEPDDSVVRFVKGSLAISGKREPKHSRGFLAEVLFDSSREPLDLRLEPQIDSENVSLIGQILDSTDPTNGTAAASVALLKGGKVIAEASTNRFGEFQLDCNLGAPLELRVKLPLRTEISISLIDPIPSGGSGGSDVSDSKAVNKLLRALKSTRKPV
jgi:hypothetical protein